MKFIVIAKFRVTRELSKVEMLYEVNLLNQFKTAHWLAEKTYR